jgi:hypothetical protein
MSHNLSLTDMISPPGFGPYLNLDLLTRMATVSQDFVSISNILIEWRQG